MTGHDDAGDFALSARRTWSTAALAVPFEVRLSADKPAAFAVRYQGQVHAYLNRCTHVPMEMDYQPNQFFDLTGHWLMCATHGAIYAAANRRVAAWGRAGAVW